MLIGVYGKEAQCEITREEDQHGAFVWFSSCGGTNYPVKLCRHLRSLFAAAHRGTVPRQMKLSAEGQEAASECECIKAARVRGNVVRPVGEGAEIARKHKCPCGSGHKFKKCHGGRELPADARRWPGPRPLADVRAGLGLPPIEEAAPKPAKKAPAPKRKAPVKAPPKPAKKAPAPKRTKK